MKLPDFTNFEPLNALRRAMGAELGTFVPAQNAERLSLEQIEQLARSGIEVPLDEVRVLEDGTLAYKDSRIILYIRDVMNYRNTEYDESSLPKFHIFNCRRLQEMRSQNRFERYVVATNETGIFQINIVRGNAQTASRTERLRVCQFCLGHLGWDAFSYRLPQQQKRQIVLGFSIKRFFEKYPKSLIAKRPAHTADTAPLNDYPANFKEISDSIKRQRAYRCDNCQLNLSSAPQFLHAHHINGLKSDSRPSNIKILCLGCHSDEPMHSHMRALPEYRSFLNLFPDRR